MIVDIPDHRELTETAIGWLNLSWEITIDSLKVFQETWIYYKDLEEEIGEEIAEKQRDIYWHAKRYKLNNAIALLQQSMELFLKARIAETSPFLLIAGEPQSWPKPDRAGQISFSDFRTIDASQLCRAAAIAALVAPNNDFNAFFERVRKQRNKITHLNAGNIRVEAQRILVDILTGFRFLFPNDNWIEFRKKYMVSTGEYSPATPYEEDFTHSNFVAELDAAIEALENKHTKSFFGYDKKQGGLSCPMCNSLRTKWDDLDCTLAQRRRDGTVYCIACSTAFTAEEYEKQVAEWKLE